MTRFSGLSFRTAGNSFMSRQRTIFRNRMKTYFTPEADSLLSPISWAIINTRASSVIWGDEDNCLMDDIFVFFSQKEQKYYYITAKYKQDLFEMWNSFHYYDDAGNDRFQVVRGYPCWERSLTDRLEYGNPSQYETGLITVD